MKRVAMQFGAFVVLIVFLSAFVKIDSKKVAILDSLPKECTDYYDISVSDTVFYNKLSNYDWYYCIYIVHYLDSSGWEHKQDTVILPPGKKLVLENVSHYMSCIKIMDNFMVNFEEGYFYGDWIPNYQELPKDKVPFFAGLRMLDDFKPEERFVFVKRGYQSSRERYFKVMQKISDRVDGVLEMELALRPFAEQAKKVCETRRNKPKLRSHLAYCSYIMCGGEGIPDELCALQEAHHVLWYAENWLLDNKKLEYSRKDLVIASAHLRFIVERILEKLPISTERKLVVAERLRLAHATSLEGQQKMLVEWLGDTDNAMFEKQYDSRCLLSNMPYAFTLWSGGYCAGATDEQLSALWDMGMYLGAGLQVINDYYDIVSDNPHRFSDIHAGVLTLPLALYLEKSDSDAEIPRIQERTKRKTVNYREMMLPLMSTFSDNEGKKLLMSATTVLLENKLLT